MSGGHEHGGPECRQLLERLSEYIDGELDADACAEVDGHIEDCTKCQEFVESLRRTVALIHRMPQPKLPEEIKKQVSAAYARLKEGNEH